MIHKLETMPLEETLQLTITRDIAASIVVPPRVGEVARPYLMSATLKFVDKVGTYEAQTACYEDSGQLYKTDSLFMLQISKGEELELISP